MSTNILIKPLITEKMTNLSEKLNRFGFVVHKNANKIQIKKAVEKMYGVNVESVNVMNQVGKFKAKYTKAGFVKGQTGSYKKAIITLAEGETIDFYSNI